MDGGTAGASGEALPRVSVVIPVRDEQGSLGPCLDAVMAQTYPVEALEILVVDGGSRDGTLDLARRYAERYPHIELLSNPAGTIPAGLNVGIRASRGDIIARVDARARLAADYLETAVALLATSGADNVGGPVRSASRTATGQALALAWSSRLGLGSAAARYGEGQEHWADTVYLGVVPRRVFESIGLYDETIVQDEDSEFNYRLRARGGRVLVSPRLRSLYTNDPSLRRIARKNFQFGAAKVAVWRKHPAMLSPRHFVPPIFVAVLALGPVALWTGGLAADLWLILMGSYALACLTVAARAYFQRRERGALLLPLVLAVIHASWGAGFLVGALRLSGWRDRPATVLAREDQPETAR